MLAAHSQFGSFGDLQPFRLGAICALVLAFDDPAACSNYHSSCQPGSYMKPVESVVIWDRKEVMANCTNHLIFPYFRWQMSVVSIQRPRGGNDCRSFLSLFDCYLNSKASKYISDWFYYIELNDYVIKKQTRYKTIVRP
jgi:hypothetical protein